MRDGIDFNAVGGTALLAGQLGIAHLFDARALDHVGRQMPIPWLEWRTTRDRDPQVVGAPSVG